MTDGHFYGIAVGEQGCAHAFFRHFARIPTVIKGWDNDFGLVFNFYLGDFSFGNRDLNDDVFGVDDFHDGLQGDGVFTDVSIDSCYGAADGCRECVVLHHGLRQIEGRLRFLEVGFHLFPLDFRKTAIVVHFFETIISIFGLTQSGLG